MAFNLNLPNQALSRPLTVLLALLLFFSLGAGAEAGRFKIIGFGDSLMAGYQLGPAEGFTDQLERKLNAAGYEVEVVNAGVSGDTTTGGLARLDWSVPDGADLVILELGANGALRGIAPEITEKNLDTMISALKSRGITVLLAGMLAPPNMGPDYEAAFNSIYPRLAETHGVALYPFFLDGVAADSELLLADGMHPNPAGVSAMVEGILPVLTPILDQLAR